MHVQLLLAPTLALPGHEHWLRRLEPGHEYVLFGQTVVRLYPPPGQYELAAHTEHGLDWPVRASPVKPALHRQYATPWLEAGDVELGGQAGQYVERGEAE